MKAIIVSVVSALGALVAATATAGCAFCFIDEPKMPNKMLEK